MATSQTDRNLLFVVIALQLDIIDQRQFVEACAVWALHMDRPMADLVEELGLITPDDRQEITRNLERKLKPRIGESSRMGRRLRRGTGMRGAGRQFGKRHRRQRHYGDE